MALEVLFCSGDDASPQHWSVLRAILNINTPKNYIRLLGGVLPIHQSIITERKASCGALGGHFHRQQKWSAMVVLVNVGHWRLATDQPTIGIVKIVNGSIFFYSYVDPIHS
jgi:hypothetical protein